MSLEILAIGCCWTLGIGAPGIVFIKASGLLEFIYWFGVGWLIDEDGDLSY